MKKKNALTETGKSSAPTKISVSLTYTLPSLLVLVTTAEDKPCATFLPVP